MTNINKADFTPTAPSFKKLVYLSIQKLTNFPYIEADFDALTNYEILSKVVEYLNQVISNNNEQNETVTNLYNAYVSLQVYVNNYFDNLDVQEEINNKLEDMAESGELTNLIKDYVDPIFNSYVTEVNLIIDDQNNNISEFEDSVDGRLNTMNAKIDIATSGSPLVASSVAGMTDTTRVYVNTTDGNWYYYDGDSWEIGGTYQSTGIGLNSIKEENLSEDLQDILDISIPTITIAENGKYINFAGVITSASGFVYSEPIELKQNKTIKYLAKGYLTNISMISTCDSLGDNIKPVAISVDSNINEYSYTATEDTYVILSYDSSTTPSNLSISKHIENIEDRLTDTENKFIIPIPSYTLTNEYINNNGEIVSASNFRTSSPIPLKAGSILYMNALGYSTVISMITETTSDGTVIQPLVISSDNEYHLFTYQAKKDMYVRISYAENYNITLKALYNLYDFNTISSLLNSSYNNEADISNLKELTKFNILPMFSNITCIGDSLTFSQVYTSNNTSRQAYETYPEVLNKLTGVSTRSLALGGDTSTSWWNREKDNIIQEDNQLTIIYLGTNGGLTDTINTDCVGDDYTQYADTYTGNYGKIIQKSLDVGSKVILVKCYENSPVFDTTNIVIDKMGTRFNVPVVSNYRFTENLYHYYPDGTGTNYVHYNDLGYTVFTQYLMNNINNLSEDNLKLLLPV